MNGCLWRDSVCLGQTGEVPPVARDFQEFPNWRHDCRVCCLGDGADPNDQGGEHGCWDSPWHARQPESTPLREACCCRHGHRADRSDEPMGRPEPQAGRPGMPCEEGVGTRTATRCRRSGRRLVERRVCSAGNLGRTDGPRRLEHLSKIHNGTWRATA